MHGQPGLDIELIGLSPGAAVFDCVYSPMETPLLAQARRHGLTPVDGLGMLLHQAKPGFRAWFGVDPEITDELRALVAQGL
jgi:shikimate dehydrogenase